MSNNVYYRDFEEDGFEEEYEVLQRDFTWAGHFFSYFQFFGAVLFAASRLADEIARDLGGVHNKVIESRQFRRSASKEIETILKDS